MDGIPYHLLDSRLLVQVVQELIADLRVGKLGRRLDGGLLGADYGYRDDRDCDQRDEPGDDGRGIPHDGKSESEEMECLLCGPNRKRQSSLPVVRIQLAGAANKRKTRLLGRNECSR